MSDSLGLVDVAIGLVNSVFNLPDGQVMFFEEFELQKNCEINLLIKTFLGLIEMMLGLQGAKKIIFAASPDVISTSPKSFLKSRIDLTVLLLFKFLKKDYLPIGQVKNRIL